MPKSHYILKTCIPKYIVDRGWEIMVNCCIFLMPSIKKIFIVKSLKIPFYFRMLIPLNGKKKLFELRKYRN